MYHDVEPPPAASSRLTRWLLPLLNLEGTRQQVAEAVIVAVSTVSLLILLVATVGLQVTKLVAALVTRLQVFG